jgi:hypothetical protein
MLLYCLVRCYDGLVRTKHVAVLYKDRIVIGYTLESFLLSVLKHNL